MTLFMIIALSTFVYGMVGGMTYKAYDKYGNFYDEFGPMMCALFWFLTVPAGLGILLMDGKMSLSHTPRAEVRREKEIAEALHKKKLAEIAAEELAINERSLNIK